ncbi:MAG TPA: metal ABC transporter substrate-binding protein [Nitrospiria bacterium]|nr:metal ABC transporter substrate-binding protein [Nitrospiria bacterium]
MNTRGRWLVGIGALAAMMMIGPADAADTGKKIKVLTTVAPITNIVRNVAGSNVELHGLIPEGSDSHTFEPVPSDVKYVANADLIIINGLHLETPTMHLVDANKKKGSVVVQLADQTIAKKEWVFDFSFPADKGDPNPHLWLNAAHGMKYAELVRNALVKVDPANKAAYDANATAYLAKLKQLDEAIMATMKTIPEKNRKLVTYHDSWAYFCPRYGCKVIGAVQPSDFAQPTPQDMVALINQLKAEAVPAIFGSEVFPSKVLDQIGREAGVNYVDTLRDDDLPGGLDDPKHTYVGMMKENVETMARVLGGDASALKNIDPSNVGK